MFNKAQIDRYARHIILPGVGIEGQHRLTEARVLVVGAGGLGSPALQYLAAAGVGTLGVVDSDRVELSNLQRQVIFATDQIGKLKVEAAAERLQALNPEIEVRPHAERLSKNNAQELIRDYDIVLDGSDNFPTRYLVNDACVIEDRPLIYGAISRFEGQISLLHGPTVSGFGPCYRCLFPEPPSPGTVPSCAEAGVLNVLPGVVGSVMASETIKLILGFDRLLTGKLVYFDALEATFHSITFSRKPDCPVCGKHPTVTELIDYAAFCGEVVT
jgi:molybdopterin/thiamine biosynthesis adenylyltransferase